MDTTTLTILAIVAQTILLTAGGTKFILWRVQIVREEMNVMRAKQEERIERAERDGHKIKENYNAKFQKVHDSMHEMELKIVSSLSALELNLRSSHHTLADNVTKALAHLEMLITQKHS